MLEQDIAAPQDEAMTPRERNWRKTAAQYLRNQHYYSGLIDQASETLGEAMFTRDDGSLTKEPLRIKLPEVVADLVDERDRLKKNVEDLTAVLDRMVYFAENGCVARPEFLSEVRKVLDRVGSKTK